MNEAQQARRIAVIALIAVLVAAVVMVLHDHKILAEDQVIAEQINKHFEFFDKRLERLEKKVGAQP